MSDKLSLNLIKKKHIYAFRFKINKTVWILLGGTCKNYYKIIFKEIIKI